MPATKKIDLTNFANVLLDQKGQDFSAPGGRGQRRRLRGLQRNNPLRNDYALVNVDN